MADLCKNTRNCEKKAIILVFEENYLNTIVILFARMERSIRFRFIGPSFEYKKIQHSKLFAISKSIHAMTKRIKYLDGEDKTSFDFNISLFDGSVGLECSPLNDGNIKDMLTLKKLAGTISSFDEDSENAIEVYSEDYIIRKNLKYLVNKTKKWAEQMELSESEGDKKIPLSKVRLNEALIEKITTRKEASGEYTHLALIHLIKSRPTKIGITTYNKKYDIDFNTVDSEKFRNYWDKFALIKYAVYPDKSRKFLSIDNVSNKPNFNDSLVKDAIEKIDSFKKYDNNWDSQDSKAINTEMINTAKEKYALFTNLLKKQNIGIIPSVVPVPNGNIQFEYQDEDNYFEIELTSGKKAIIYLVYGSQEFIYDNIDFELAIDLVIQYFRD